MSELLNILVSWFSAVSNYKITDFWSFVTAILQSFGYPGEFVGPSSMAEYADWIASMFGPLTPLYELFLKSIDTATFIEIVNKIFAFLNK